MVHNRLGVVSIEEFVTETINSMHDIDRKSYRILRSQLDRVRIDRQLEGKPADPLPDAGGGSLDSVVV